MTNLDNCVREIIRGLEKYDNLTEDEKVRFIYLFLGKKISFSTKWVYGGDHIKKAIYRSAGSMENIEKCLANEKWEMICKDSAHIASYIGKSIGADIEVVQPCPVYYDPCPHVYNRVIRKDGSSYCIDLDSDLYLIAMNMRTNYFGFYEDKPWKKVFSRKQLEEIDYKLGYITRQKPYTDEYFYSLFNYVLGLDSANDKVKVMLENPSPYDNLDIGFNERKMYIIFPLIKAYRNNPMNHAKINWEWLDFYYNIDSSIVPKEIIYVEGDKGKIFYEFDSKKGNYHQISEEDFGKMLSNGLCLSDVYKNEQEGEPGEYQWIDDLKSKYLSKGK